MRIIVAVTVLAVLGALACRREISARRGRDSGPAVVVVEATRGDDEIDVPMEREPNDDAGQAESLRLPGQVRGRIDRAGDVDVFAIAPLGSVTLRVSLGATTDADLVLEVQDGAGKRLLTVDSGPAGTVETVPNLGVEPGLVRLVVREFVKKAKGTAAPRPMVSWLAGGG